MSERPQILVVDNYDSFVFTIVGNQLRTAALLDRETKASYSIRLRATDTGSPSRTFDKIFTVTATNVNETPVVSNLADVTIDEDTSTGAIPFTISDPETPAGALVVTRSSSNTTLVPLGGVALGGSGQNRTVTVTPAAGKTGSSTITVQFKGSGMVVPTINTFFSLDSFDKIIPCSLVIAGKVSKRRKVLF